MNKQFLYLLFFLLIALLIIFLIKRYKETKMKPKNITEIYKFEKMIKPLYREIHLKDVFKNYPKKVKGLRFGYICPGAMNTISYLNLVSESKPNLVRIVNEIKMLTDLQFFLEIYVIYRKYVDRNIIEKIKPFIKYNTCAISELITERITVLFNSLPKKVKTGLPDDFYHIRHNTLICSKNKKLAEQRIQLLKNKYGTFENFNDINGCNGKRNGVSGCRDCCKSKLKYSECVDSCMKY